MIYINHNRSVQAWRRASAKMRDEFASLNSCHGAEADIRGSDLLLFITVFGMLVRRMLALLLAASLVGGFAGHFLRTAATAGGPVIVASIGVPLSAPADHHGCADYRNAVLQTACSGSCASALALPTLTVAFESISLGRLEPTAGPAIINHDPSPQPYPPKSA